MKNVFRKILGAVAAGGTFLLSGCTFFGINIDMGGDVFGEFSFNGHTLTAYARSEISSSVALGIVQANANSSYSSNGIVKPLGYLTSDIVGERPLPDTSTVNYIAQNYASCDIEILYYLDDEDDQQSKTYSIQGADLKNMIAENKYMPFSQLSVGNLVMFDDLITYMESANTVFTANKYDYIAPFSQPYTFHKDSDGDLVIQMRDYSELSSSESGGVTCNFRQDIEFAYNAHNLLTHWQTSLGIYISTPQETEKQGYIYEVNLTWTYKN